MIRRPAAVLVVLLLCLVATALASETGQVTNVVDGDTLKVAIGGPVETIRLIGVDTPETVHPNKPVEFFGKEASAFTRRMAEGQLVRLEADAQGTDRDKYGRLLRYVFLPDGKLLNAEIISQGYGHAYTRFPFSRMEEFRALERQAREANRGLWGAAGDPAGPSIEKPDAKLAPGPPADPAATVYVTRSGTKYHREGCRHLSKSAIPLPLNEAAGRYAPCSACSPPRLQEGTSEAPIAPAGPSVGETATPKAAASEGDANQSVFVTKTGTKYHRAGCRYLAKSAVPISLKDASGTYLPCSVCQPPTLRSSAGASVSPAPPTTRSPPASGGRCIATTKEGTQCKRAAAAGSAYCWQHGR